MKKPLPHGFEEEVIGPWLKLTGMEAQDHYFRELLPKVVEHVREDEESMALERDGYGVLISLMGMSPETTVITAAVVRPKRLVVVYGQPDDDREKGLVTQSFNRAVDYLRTHGILEFNQIDQRLISPTDPVDIYRVIQEALQQAPLVAAGRSAIVDVTGGKKVMSATAGQAAWESRVPLCYVDGRYNATWRRPHPGSERVLKLASPSDQERSLLRVNALALYQSRSFAEAITSLKQSSRVMVDNQLELFLHDACIAYSHWLDLDLPKLAISAQQAIDRLSEARTQTLYCQRPDLATQHREHFGALLSVASDRSNETGLLASFRELARLYGSQQLRRFDFACLLLYRSMEAVVEVGLKRLLGSDFSLQAPDYTTLCNRDAILERYGAIADKVGSRTRNGETPRTVGEVVLPERVGFLSGLVLLKAAEKIDEPISKADIDLIKRLRGAAELRNSSILAHGRITLTEADFNRMSGHADELTEAVLSQEQVADVNRHRRHLQLLDASTLSFE
jgi:hypothetical protein